MSGPRPRARGEFDRKRRLATSRCTRLAAAARAAAALSLAVALTGPALPAAALPALDLGPFAGSAELTLTEFASGLDFPFGIADAADGSLLVGSSVPRSPGGSLFVSTGRVLRLIDADRDGVADGAPALVLDGLAGPVTGVRRAGEHLVVAHRGRISFFRLGPSPTDPLTPEGTLDFAFPTSWVHSSLGIAVSERPPAPSPGFHLFFHIGSRTNATASVERIALGGLLTATLEPDSVYRVTLTPPPGPGPLVASELTWVARGLRNALGIALDPRTGDLYLADNGIDGFTDPNEPLSADELDLVPAAAIGGPVEDFGFPDSFVRYRTGEIVGSRGTLPVVAFQPLPPPNGAESEGPSEIAFAPPGFPPGLDRGLFVTFHGRFALGGLANEENPLVFVDPATRQYFHLIGNREPDVGHLDSLHATADTLYLADLSRTGATSGSATGVLYAVRPVPEPAGTGTLLLAAVVMASIGAKRAQARRTNRARGGRQRCP